eukprot:3825787-Rhodomonas_salina.1
MVWPGGVRVWELGFEVGAVGSAHGMDVDMALPWTVLLRWSSDRHEHLSSARNELNAETTHSNTKQ